MLSWIVNLAMVGDEVVEPFFIQEAGIFTPGDTASGVSG